EELAGCHEALGRMLTRVKRHPDAEAAYRRAIELREGLLDGAPDPARARCELGATVGEVGRLMQIAGRRQEAEAHLDRAVALLADRPGGPDGAAYEECLGAALGHLAEMRGGRDELGQ